jgi:hypothetical protein
MAAHGILVVFDLTDEQSLNSALGIYNAINPIRTSSWERPAGMVFEDQTRNPTMVNTHFRDFVYFVGNKSDMVEGKETLTPILKRNGLKWWKISCKDHQSVQLMFEELTDIFYTTQIGSNVAVARFD